MLKTLALSAVLAVFTAVSAEEVVTLTSDNFQNTIDSNEFVLVEFYAPWCGHCKALAPEYEKAAVTLKNYEPKVVIAKVDATKETDLSKEFGVQGFPTLKWFVNGKAMEYGGGRDEKTIVSWVKKKTGPAAKTLEDASALESFKSSADAVAVGIFSSDAEAKAFLKAAQGEEEVPYGVAISNNAVASAAGVEAPAVVVLQNFDEGKAVYSGDLSDEDAIGKFVSANSLPLLVPFSQENAPKIFGGAVKSHVLMFVDEEKNDEVNKIKEAARPVAKENKGDLLFVLVEKKEKRIVDFFGIKDEEFPTLRIVNLGESGMKKYKFTDTELTTDAISKFVGDYNAGKLPQDLKSEEPMPESEQGNVYVLVGKSFEEVVNRPGVDVLVEFYAPWCGHCKKLEPEYNALGEHFAGNDKILIAKMDATANEVERVSVSGFPTIKLFPADSDEIIDFEGPRDKKGMLAFLEKNAVNLQK